jgi:peptidoglycan L-alanyl-D-glutamate endopeptidase CwlK
MSSRLIVDLLPDVGQKATRWLDLCHLRGAEPLIYCTWRSPEEQAVLYAQGRTVPGRKVTNAQPWQSWHQVRRAWDAVPMNGGKPIWTYDALSPDWQVLIEVADELGIEWAGRWKTFMESCHWQVTGGLTLAEARAQVEGART